MRACLLLLCVACTGGTSNSAADASSSSDAPNAGEPDAVPGDPTDAAAAPDARNARAPTWSDDLTAPSSAWYSRASASGSAVIGAAAGGSSDGVARLVFGGDPARGPADRVGPAFASEIGTHRTFTGGELRARIRLARCGAHEDLVNGVFLFANDGADHDGDGIADNPELDIEILCATPTAILLSSWTDYDGATGQFRRLSHGVDLATGAIYDSPSDRAYGIVRTGTDPSLVRRGFPRADTFYEMAVAWSRDLVRFSIVIDGEELTLWELRDTRYIPTAPMTALFNVWHPGEHWFPPDGPADHPSSDGVMEIDWVRYWEP
jgi:hypothetical protein